MFFPIDVKLHIPWAANIPFTNALQKPTSGTQRDLQVTSSKTDGVVRLKLANRTQTELSRREQSDQQATKIATLRALIPRRGGKEEAQY